MAREILRTALAPGPECLSMEQLGRYADGALRAEEQAAADAHIRGCLNCQAELALMHAVTSGGARTGEPAAPRSLRRGWPLFAAAAAVLVVVAGGLFLRPGQPPELPGRVTTGDEVARALAVVVRGPVGDQAEPPARLEWRAAEGATRYRVRLMEVDRREVWSTSTAALEVELPPTVRTTLTPGRTFLWDVTAYDAPGAAMAESGAQSFRVVVR